MVKKAPIPSTPIVSIQYLRAFAALLVVLHHARNPQLWLYNPMADNVFAARGVDIFFVISGFIMYTAARDEPVATFAWRRFWRVIPLYWLATLTWVGIGLALGTGFSRLNVARSLALIPFKNPSFEGHIWPVLVPGWTLMYEMFFYAIFALALISGRLVGATTAIVLGLVAVGLLFSPTGAAGVTYTSPLMIEFVVGIWLGVAFRRLRFPVLWPLLPAGIVALPFADLAKFYAMPPGLIPAALIVAGALALEQRIQVPRIATGKLLGDASYSIYLFHTIIKIGSDKFVEALPLAGPVQFAAMITVTMVGTTLGGIAVYRWIERPLIAAGRRFDPTRVGKAVPL
jgi:exopolysaccharide production protein ExoZ